MQSADITADRLASLRDLLPEAFTEGKVDFDKLRQALGDEVDDRPERYSFTWAGKRDAMRLLQVPSRATLVPCPQESVDWDTTQNLFIEGENLEVLKLLYKSYAGRVKMIYIDPPYNTGNDFIYPDDFRDPLQTYLKLTGQKDAEGNLLTSNPESSGRYHSAWLSMMYPRLFVARQLLRDDGVIAISIDHHEVANLRCMLADVFGEENFINTFAWVNNLKGRQISAHGAALTHEFIAVWAKNHDLVEEFTVQVEWGKSRMPSAYKGLAYEVMQDAKGEYVLKNQLYNTNSAFNEVTRPNLVFNIHFNDTTGEVRTTDIADPRRFDGFHIITPHPCNDGRHKYHAWRWGRSKVEQEKDDLAFLVSGDDIRVFTKVRGYTTTVLKDLITDISTNEGAKDVTAILGCCPFTYPKPLSLMQLLVQSVASADEESIVMDFFAGSGTTGHAVMQQNAADGGNRRYILVQLPEGLDMENKDQKVAADFCDKIKKPHNISELTKELLRRAGKKIQEENPLFKGDLGFRIFKLAESNYRVWTGVEKKDGAAYADTMEMFADPLLPGWKPVNVLYEVALKEGYSLTSKIEKVEGVKDNTVWCVTDPDKGQSFRICLDDKLKAATLKALALAKDDLFICRDSALTDEQAANLALQCNLKTI